MPKYNTPEEETRWQEAYAELKYALHRIELGEGDPVARRRVWERAVERFIAETDADMERMKRVL